MRVSASLCRILLAVVSVGLLGGCKTWQPANVGPERLIADEHPSSIRVTTSDGATVTLRNPSIVNDSIVSRTSPTDASVTPSRPGVERSQVRSVEVARFSPRRTIVLASAIAAISIGWASAADSGGGSTIIDVPPPKLALFVWRGLGFLLGSAR